MNFSSSYLECDQNKSILLKTFRFGEKKIIIINTIHINHLIIAYTFATYKCKTTNPNPIQPTHTHIYDSPHSTYIHTHTHTYAPPYLSAVFLQASVFVGVSAFDGLPNKSDFVISNT